MTSSPLRYFSTITPWTLAWGTFFPHGLDQVTIRIIQCSIITDVETNATRI
jgi:hypothetical protein